MEFKEILIQLSGVICISLWFGLVYILEEELSHRFGSKFKDNNWLQIGGIILMFGVPVLIAYIYSLLFPEYVDFF